MSDSAVRAVQFKENKTGISLINAGGESCPDSVSYGTYQWQEWAGQATGRIVKRCDFKGRDIVMAMPANEVFIEYLKRPKAGSGETLSEDEILSRIQNKLPFSPEDSMLKFIETEGDNLIVIATERRKIDNYLGMFENLNLRLKTICVWPMALVKSYIKFFGRRNSDLSAVVMLLGIDANWTNVVICCHQNLLFARSIPVGAVQLVNEGVSEGFESFVAGLNSCIAQFKSLYRNVSIERLMFLSSIERAGIDTNICRCVAEKLSIPVQVGDCLAAVSIPNFENATVDRRMAKSASEIQPSDYNWAAAFGLSLSEKILRIK